MNPQSFYRACQETQQRASAQLNRRRRGNGLAMPCLVLWAAALAGSSAQAQTYEWTWMSGSSQNRQPSGVYGQLGVPASGNTPGGRETTISWMDTNGNLWLFGSTEDGFDGNGVDAYLDDVWEYNTSLQEWGWMAGSNSVPRGSPNGCIICAAPPVFGTYQKSAPDNTPGSLQFPAQWTDREGNLWLFGGSEYKIVGGTYDVELMNALWKFDVASHRWSWMGGSNSVNGNVPGVYGSLGQAAPGNTPGGRSGAASWIDGSGNFWLFGGNGQDSAGNKGYLNDLWMFNPSSNQWTWMGGSSTFSAACLAGTDACTAPGVPGTFQAPAAGNTPEGRDGASFWTDLQGNIWLFGGETDVSYNFGGVSGIEGTFVNDLWEFNSGTHEWAWMSGNPALSGNAPSYGNTPGVYGALRTPSATNTPGGRVSRWMQTSYTGTDRSGNLWLFGGDGFDSTSKVGQLNDLWMYDISLKEWTWMGGSSTLNPGCITGSTTCSRPGVYGTLGSSAASNAPGARGYAAQSIDQDGNFWLFGGWGTDSLGTWGYLNDLWEFNPATDLWTWMGGSSMVPNDGSNSNGQFGVYGSLGVRAATNQPGGRTAAASWTDGDGKFWIFGGFGCGGNYCKGWLNDLWELGPQPPASIAAPAFTPAPGTYTSSQSVTISDVTSGTMIYYAINATPTTSSTPYTGPIAVSSTETIEAIAVTANNSSSAVVSATYTILPPAAAPTFNPPGGTYSSAQSVAIVNNAPGTTIYYAINATPTTSSTPYNGPIPVSSTETIEAIAAGPNNSSSAVESATYTILPPAAAPSFNPPGGTYNSPQSVTLTNNAPGTTIFYAINATPTASSTPYTGPISVSSSETIEAVDISSSGGSTVSALSSATYIINLTSPTFTLNLSPNALTVYAGGSGTATVTVTPENGFNSTVSFACSGLPSGVTCSFSPPTVTPSGSAVSSQLKISASAQARLEQRGSHRSPGPWIPDSTLALAACVLMWGRREKWRLSMVLLAAFLGAGFLSGCAQVIPYAVPETMTVTVTGTSGTLQQTAQLTLTVN
jgi:hypothetical protein